MSIANVGSFVASALASPLGAFFASAVKNYMANRKNKLITTQCIVIPAGSGKTNLVQRYTEEFGLNSGVIILDVEDAVMKDPLNASIVAELQALKYTDPHRYELNLFPLAQRVVASSLAHLIEVRSTNSLVVLVSSVALKRYLKFTNSFYFAPSKKLFETLINNNPSIKNALNLSRDVLTSAEKVIQIYSSFDQLYEIFLVAVGQNRSI